YCICFSRTIICMYCIFYIHSCFHLYYSSLFFITLYLSLFFCLNCPPVIFHYLHLVLLLLLLLILTILFHVEFTNTKKSSCISGFFNSLFYPICKNSKNFYIYLFVFS